MSKIGLIYSEWDSLVKEIKRCIDSLNDEKYQLGKALNEADKISSGYTELTNIYDNLRSIDKNVIKDIEKLGTFNKKLKIYIDNVKRDDNRVSKQK